MHCSWRVVVVDEELIDRAKFGFLIPGNGGEDEGDEGELVILTRKKVKRVFWWQ